ncbi:MAG: DNA recombination protein RmuC [Treponema sp.]|jgi:DNA recombination protein RmuC|nr:DNA recombination protein RmuC [Treponema sp.]
MDIELIVELALLLIVIIQFIVMIILFSKKKNSQADVSNKLVEYAQRLEKNESTLRDEFGRNREESNRVAKDSRAELSLALKSGSEQLSTIISNFTRLVDNKITAILNSVERSSKSNRDELAASFKTFEEKSSAKVEALTKETKDGLEKTRDAVEKKLTEIQTGNEAKLDKMRETVEEKLQKTLEVRISASFKQVSDDLEKVHTKLGEMQVLASDVGDLRKVMSNVKTKGVLGEYQLAAILEEILNQGQYEQNVKTKIGSNNHVEFAVKIPSKDDSNRPVWLPIDSKLPTAAYEALNDAYNNIDKKALEDAKKIFSRTVKSFAKDIHDKYIDPPNTTDFAIMFLPIEGEYAEVVRDPELFETIRRESKVLVTGPSTIAALLNAFRVGFNSITVDKNTSKIRDLLSSVKKEFGNFENLIDKVKEKIDDAGKTLDDSFGKRTRAITRALKNVEIVSDDTVGQKLIADASSDLEDQEI